MDIALTEDQRDCLQELINVAMGQASDKLARYLETFVHLDVPYIELVSSQGLPIVFAEKYAGGNVSVVSQGFYGNEGIRGESLLIYSLDNAKEVASLLGYEPEEASENEQLADISSILTTTFLNGLAEQIENQMSYSAPRLVSSINKSLDTHLEQLSFNWELALKVDISYQVTDFSFNCDMVLLIPGEAIQNIQAVLDRILEDY
ncbi:chemotaxis protein [Saccharobesus litoralis]|uniref:Chemotaxis protein n=1 Tax=Saccharobesus litoralis TaxID=2172099 RepID=A0A2S0VSN3_9ALTE|nr:chemotaxis protein [Saccharobesus litoralis]AWB67219.1 chemotaxis protein [Saccharobesus litoralis]